MCYIYQKYSNKSGEPRKIIGLLYIQLKYMCTVNITYTKYGNFAKHNYISLTV